MGVTFPCKTDLEFLSVTLEQISKKDTMVPSYKLVSPKGIMFKGGTFGAIYNPETGMWSESENEARELIDKEMFKVRDAYAADYPTAQVPVLWTMAYSVPCVERWIKYTDKLIKQDSWKPLDQRVTYKSDVVGKDDYRSIRLGYDPEPGPTPNWDRLLSVLYDAKNREKIEYAIGSIGDGPHVKEIQKYYVFYGEGGKGKSTILNIMKDYLFPGYASEFSSSELASSTNQFPFQSLAHAKLISIDGEADLNNLATNSRFNAIASGEAVTINLKQKQPYTEALNTTMFLATNEPLKITNRNAGSVRRVIDIEPTGNTLPRSEYDRVMAAIKYEAPYIMHRCIEVYRSNPKRYKDYTPDIFIGLTDPIHNFIETRFEEYKRAEYVFAGEEWDLYTIWADKNGVDRTKYNSLKFKKDMNPYFEGYKTVNNKRNTWYGFLSSKFLGNETSVAEEFIMPAWLELNKTHSKLDDVLKDCPAQVITDPDGKSCTPWDYVTTTLKSIDTHELHYVRPGDKLVVIDFDIRDSDGKKSPEGNLKKCYESGLPPTYAEYSKSGGGVHLHYWYAGDTSELDRLFSPNVEIKVYRGKQALRRKLTYCNDVDIATLPVGSLPTRKVKAMLDEYTLENEKHMRALIDKALRKEVCDKNTITCMQYIVHVFEEAKNNGVEYNLITMKPSIIAFAAQSTNHSADCLRLEGKIEYCNHKEHEEPIDIRETELPLAIYDCESFPNRFGFVVSPVDTDEMFVFDDPKPQDVIRMSTSYRLIGFNNAGYDDYMMYACAAGNNVRELNKLSRMITADKKTADGQLWAKLKYSKEWSPAKAISYCDIYDFSSVKQSLKKFQTQMKMTHEECAYDWTMELNDEQWKEVMEYCCNDVKTTKALFLSKDRQGDYKARLMLAAVTGLPARTSTNNLTKALIFGDDKTPQDEFNYRFLGEDPGDGRVWFPGYKFENGKSSYMDVPEVGEGGYVYSAPGTYHHVVTYDVASMHPSSIIAENLFGDVYTKRFKDIKDLRVLIKHKKYEEASKMLDGVFAPYLDDPSDAKAVAQALKIAINSVYGLTSAKFPNAFKDPRNVDNIVAKRGALFMITLRNAVQDMGGIVVHCKTDSIKVENPSPEIDEFIRAFGQKYGYDFEVEDRFAMVCLIDKAQFIARLEPDDEAYAESVEKGENGWFAKGTRFLDPYVFKTMFTHQKITIDDYCCTKECKGKMYLGDEFVGKNGNFICVTEESGVGRELTKIDGDKVSYVTGTKGYLWVGYDTAIARGYEKYVNLDYYNANCDKVWADMVKHGICEEDLDD